MVKNISNAFSHGMSDNRDMRPLEDPTTSPDHASNETARKPAMRSGYVHPRTRRFGVTITEELYKALRLKSAESGLSMTALTEAALDAALLSGGLDMGKAYGYDEKQ